LDSEIKILINYGRIKQCYPEPRNPFQDWHLMNNVIIIHQMQL